MYVRQTFTATASQTTFTITGGYTAYKLDVFQNGVKLVNSDVGISRDVDVSNGTTIVLATGAAVGDVIDVIGLTSGNFAGPATARRQSYTATAGQTTFTVSGGYTVGQLDVFQNGTKLVTAVDVDVSNGSTFTLTTPAVAGDSLEVVGFTAADTVSGTLQFQAGTAAAPSITTFGDTNTGIFFPAADTIAFSEGGAEAMRITSNGNVGIGNSSPARLLTVDNATNPEIGLYNSGTERVKFSTGGSAGSQLAIDIGGTEAMRIDSSRNVGIGVLSPQTTLHIKNNGVIRINNPDGTRNLELFNDSSFAEIKSSVDPIRINTPDNVRILTGATPTERLRITSGGYLKASNTGTYINSAAAVHEIRNDSSGNEALLLSNSATTAPYGIQIRFTSSPNDVTSQFLNCNDGNGTTNRAIIRSNGGILNYQANDGNFSDERLKTDIQPSPSYLDKICSIPVINFKYKDQTHNDYNLGVIAQQVESVCPELVDADGVGETPEDGIPIKAIYQTDLQYALMKCIQELKSENNSLKSRIEALEAA
jgi:hypothetical protein